MPTATEFLLPVLALVAWTLVMWFWLYATRIPAMQAITMRASATISSSISPCPTGMKAAALPNGSCARWQGRAMPDEP